MIRINNSGLIAVFMAVSLSAVAAWGESNRATSEELVAGRTLDQTAQQIDSDNRTERLRGVKSLAAFGESAGPKLSHALGHQDAAVRYIAAVQLGRLGGKALEDAKPQLTNMMHDKSSVAVQMAAAFALCRAGQPEDALPLLVQRVQIPQRATACSAAELIGMLGAAAESTKEVLASVAKANPPSGSGDYHIGGAAQKALRQIEAELQE